MYLELTEVNSNLSAIIGPLLLGGATAAYLAGAGGGTAAAGGVMLLIGRARDAVMSNLGAVAAGTAAAGVATVAAVAVTMGGGGGGDGDTAEPPVPGITQIAPSSASSPTPERTKEPKPSPLAAATGVVNVVNPPPSPSASPTALPTPSELGRPSANISLASATITDNVVVLDVDGLPPRSVFLTVDLESASGETTFAAQRSACSVRPANKTRAVCLTSAGSGGAGVLMLAPSSFQAVIPLEFPDTLESDELSVTVSIPAYDDPAGENNTATLSFIPTREPRPTQPTPTLPTPTLPTPTLPTPTLPTPTLPTPTLPTPTLPTPTEPTPTPTAPDLHLTLTAVNATTVNATVTGVPDKPTTLVFTVTTSDGVTLDDKPTGCTPADAAGVLSCSGIKDSFDGNFTFTYSGASADVTIAVEAEDSTDPDLSDNQSSVRLERPTTKLTLDLEAVQSLLHPGRFLATVRWPELAVDPSQIRFHDITTDPVGVPIPGQAEEL